MQENTTAGDIRNADVKTIINQGREKKERD